MKVRPITIMLHEFDFPPQDSLKHYFSTDMRYCEDVPPPENPSIAEKSGGNAPVAGIESNSVGSLVKNSALLVADVKNSETPVDPMVRARPTGYSVLPKVENSQFEPVKISGAFQFQVVRPGQVSLKDL